MSNCRALRSCLAPVCRQLRTVRKASAWAALRKQPDTLSCTLAMRTDRSASLFMNGDPRVFEEPQHLILVPLHAGGEVPGLPLGGGPSPHMLAPGWGAGGQADERLVEHG